MGAREDLLEGAKRCLLEKGYHATTARDIAAASGANLASIGYHYGSKQALMREALIRATGEWGDAVQEAMSADVSPDTDSLTRHRVAWERAEELLDQHRGVGRAQFEALTLMDQDPELRAVLLAAQPEARRGLVSLFQGIPEEEVSEDDARVLGSFYFLLVAGLLVQSTAGLGAPNGRDLTEAIRRIAG